MKPVNRWTHNQKQAISARLLVKTINYMSEPMNARETANYPAIRAK